MHRSSYGSGGGSLEIRFLAPKENRAKPVGIVVAVEFDSNLDRLASSSGFGLV